MKDINEVAQAHSSEIFTELLKNRVALYSPATKSASLAPSFSFSIEKNSSIEKKNQPSENLATSAVQHTSINTNNDNGQQNNPIRQTSISSSTSQNKTPEPMNPSATPHSNGTPPVSNLAPPSEVFGRLNTAHPDSITYETEQLKITLCGGIELYNLKRLRVTLHIQLQANTGKDYRDTLDLYSNSQRKRLIQETSEELEFSTSETSKAIVELTNGLEQYRNKKAEQKRKEQEALKDKDRETFTAQEMQAGARLLNEKQLMKQTYKHIEQIGLIGQEKNGMLLYFIYLTRMFREPLHALVQGLSNEGKTYLLKKIIHLVPKLHYKIITAMSENALYYALEGVLKHIILLLEDLQGAYKAFFAIRELMSSIVLRKWITVSNPKTGELEPKDLYVEGPTCIAGATTEDKIYEDNANRSFQIQLDENAERTNKILDRQLEEAAGLIDSGTEKNIQTIFKTAQLQLRPVAVRIPFAQDLRIPEYIFKKHRTNKHYIILIQSIAFWHQKQRKWKTDKHGNPYIEATLEDVWWANYLCKESLLRKSDELSPELRSFFERLKNTMKQGNKNQFFAKDIRNRLHPEKLRRALTELRQRGFLKQIVYNRKTGHEYEIIVWDDYDSLQKSVNILDTILESIAKKHNLKIDKNLIL